MLVMFPNDRCHALLQGGPKSKQLPNDQKIVLDLFVKLKYESRTIILFAGIRYSIRDLLSDLNNYVVTRKQAICVRYSK